VTFWKISGFSAVLMAKAIIKKPKFGISFPTAKKLLHKMVEKKRLSKRRVGTRMVYETVK
jgi:hypothetical protein